MRAALLTLLLLFLPLAGTQTPGALHAQEIVRGTPMELPVDDAPLVVEGEEATFEVEIADTSERRARGLMFRTDLPEDRGMLFVFEETRPVGFWMKNTPLPLDLVFIDEQGVVIDVLPGEPFSTASISPDAPSRFVLELNAGAAERTGIEPGTQISHPAIDAAAEGD